MTEARALSVVSHVENTVHGFQETIFPQLHQTTPRVLPAKLSLPRYLGHTLEEMVGLPLLRIADGGTVQKGDRTPHSGEPEYRAGMPQQREVPYTVVSFGNDAGYHLDYLRRGVNDVPSYEAVQAFREEELDDGYLSASRILLSRLRASETVRYDLWAVHQSPETSYDVRLRFAQGADGEVLPDPDPKLELRLNHYGLQIVRYDIDQLNGY